VQILFLFVVLMVLITCSVPIGFAIGGATLLTLAIFSDIPLVVITQNCFTGVDSFPLMAIPFFILSGFLMRSGGMAKRLVNVANIFVGFITGGLAMVTVLACMFFGAISGSSVATVSAIGSFMIPAMKEKGYNKAFSTALTSAAGTIGVIIPPSIPFVVFGVVTNTSIGSLFIAGIIPGFLLSIGFMIVAFIICKKRGYGGYDRVQWKDALTEIWEAKWALFAPVLILGGIYGGIFTPTEAAVVSVVYALIVGVFIYRELSLEIIIKACKDAMVINGITTFMVGFSSAFAAYLCLEQVPQQLFNLILVGITDNKILILLLINLFLLLVGCFIDNIAAVIILAPILMPILLNFGINPIHAGIFLTINLSIGMITPPYGSNLFVGCAIGGVRMIDMVKFMWPFLVSAIVVLLLVTYFPIFSMVLIK